MIKNYEIVNLMKSNYNIIVENINKINDGSADIYIINKKYVLKYYQREFELEKILKSINISNYLYHCNYNVPKYYKTIANKYYFVYKKRFGLLMNYLKGKKVNAFCATKIQLINAANFYANLELDMINYKGKLPLYDVKSCLLDKIEESICNINILSEKTSNKLLKKDLLTRIKLLEKIDMDFYNDVDKITVCNCHGDFYISQCLYKNGLINGILDFESAKKMPIVIEIIRSYIYFDKNIDINNLILYVNNFNNVFKLNIYDLKYMPYLYYLKLLTSSFGYKQYIENHKRKKEYLLIGTRLQNQILYLSKNSEIISNKLMSIVNL